ncbi:MAG: hypothetical protein IH945_02525 [Armatimonadetes bacterium]|nr:hypothetical protein [Armatimonadota bacterium]
MSDFNDDRENGTSAEVSFLNFLADPDDLTDVEVREELEEKGINVRGFKERVFAEIEKIKGKRRLELARGALKEQTHVNSPTIHRGLSREQLLHKIEQWVDRLIEANVPAPKFAFREFESVSDDQLESVLDVYEELAEKAGMKPNAE